MSLPLTSRHGGSERDCSQAAPMEARDGSMGFDFCGTFTRET